MSDIKQTPAATPFSVQEFQAQHGAKGAAAQLNLLRSSLPAGTGTPGWSLEYARLLVETGAEAEAQAVLSALIARRPKAASAYVELAQLLDRQGRTTEALETLEQGLAEAPEHPRMAVLWLQMLTQVYGGEVAHAIAYELIEQKGVLRLGGRGVATLANWLVDAGHPEQARALVDHVDPGDDQSRVLALFAAARAAQRMQASEAARTLVTEAVLGLVPQPLFNPVRAALADLVFGDAEGAAVDRIIAQLPNVKNEIARAAELRVMTAQSDVDMLIATLAPEGRIIDATPAVLLPLLYAVHDLGDYDRLRAFIDQCGVFEAFDAGKLKAVMQVATCLEDPALIARLSRLALARMGDRPDDTDTLVLAANLAIVDDTGDAAAGRIIAQDQAGRTDLNLACFLTLHGAEVAARIADAGLAARFAGLLERVPRILDAHTGMDAILREKRLTGMMLRAMGKAGPARVSILIPVHRADDLDNVRRNITAQDWPDLEVIVLPNGPLAGAAAVAQVLGDVPGVRILDGATGTIGAVLNAGIGAATGDYIFRMDADDIYLTSYITNMVSTLAAAGADVIYKPSMFVHLRAIDRVVLQASGQSFDHQIGGNGATQGFRAEVLKTHRYTEKLIRSEDVHLCRAIVRAGGRVVTADPFDFVVTRHQDKARHTWHISDFHIHGTRTMAGDGRVIPALGNTVFA